MGVETGTLYSSIRIVEGVPEVESYYGVAAGPEGSMPSDYDYIEKTIVAGGMEYIKPTGEPCDYSESHHDGFHTRSGGWVNGTFFLSDAISINEIALDELLDNMLTEAIEENV